MRSSWYTSALPFAEFRAERWRTDSGEVVVAIPNNYIKRRDLLHSEKSSPAALSAVAKELFAAERFSEALDFFEKARDIEGIQRIKSYAQERGDTFLLGRLERFDRTLVSKADWDAATAKAIEAGRPSMAESYIRKLAKAASARALEEKPGETPLE
jgi:tetratricopeptide (TPR) repeat protein